MTLIRLQDNRVLTLLFVFGLCLVPLLWFKDGYIINGADVDFGEDNIRRLISRAFGWDFQILGGTNRANNISSLPAIFIPAIYECFISSQQTVQKLTYVTYSAIYLFSVKYFLDVVESKNSKSIFYAKLFALLFAYINFYNQFLWLRLQLGLFAVSYFFIIFGLLLNIIKKRYSNRKILLIGALATTVCAPIGLQPPMIQILVFFFLLYIGIHYFFVSTTPNILYLSKKCTVLLIGVLVGGLWWMIPLAIFILDSGYGGSFGKETYNSEQLIAWVSTVTNFYTVLTLLGDVPWHDTFSGQLYYLELNEFINTRSSIVLSLLLLSLILASIFFFQRNHPFILPFTGMLVVALIFSRGSNGFFGPLYILLLDYLPTFWIQRAPWQKFTSITVICYTFFGFLSFRTLLVYCNKLARRTKLKRTLIAGVILTSFSLLGYQNHTFLLGKMFVFGEGNQGFHEKFNLGFHQKYPSYIQEAADFLNEDQEVFNILKLPDSHTNIYTWGYGGANDVAHLFINKGFLFREFGEGFVPPNSISQMYDLVIQRLKDTSEETETLSLLGLLNVKYILFRHDFRNNFYGPSTIDSNYRQLLLSFNLKKHTFGEWELFEIPKEYRIGLFSAATVPATNPSKTISGQAALEAKFQDFRFQAPHSEFGGMYATINRMIYKLKINDGQNFLILNQNYSDLWQLYDCSADAHLSGKVSALDWQQPPAEYLPLFLEKLVEAPQPSDVFGNLATLTRTLFSIVGCKNVKTKTKAFGFANGWVIDEHSSDNQFVVINVLLFWILIPMFLSMLTLGAIACLFIKKNRTAPDV